MIDTTWLKILRDLWLYKTRTLLVVLAIAVGVSAFGVMFTTQIVLARDLSRGYLATQPAHAVLTMAPFNEKVVDEVAKRDVVQQAEPRRLTNASLEQPNGESFQLQLQSIPDFTRLAISRLNVEPQSLMPPPPGTILLERSAQALLALEQGDAITVKLASGDRYDLTVAGFVQDLAHVPFSIQPTAHGYITEETAELMAIPLDYNQLYLVLAEEEPSRVTVEAAVTEVVTWLEDGGSTIVRVFVPEPQKYILEDNLQTVALLLSTLGTLTLVLSAFLVTNVMSALMAQQVSQIGIIKALGGRGRQIARIYLRTVVIFGLLALLISVPLGVAGAYFQARFIAAQLNMNLLSFGLPYQTLLLQIAGAIGIPLLAALFPIANGARITIREATGGFGTRALPASGLLARIEGMPRLLALSLRNMFRQKGRMGLTVAALSLAGAMFMSVFSVRSALFRAMDEIAAEANYDVEIDFVRPQLIEQLEQEALAVPGVVRVESWGMVNARRVYDDGRLGGSFLLVGVPNPTQLARPHVREGRWLEAGDEGALFLNSEAQSLSGFLAVDDEVELHVGGDSEKTWHVIGVSPYRILARAYVSYGDFEQATGQQGYAGRLVVETERHEPASQSSVEAALRARFDDRNIEVLRSGTTMQSRQATEAQMGSLIILLVVMAGLITVVGGLGLASAMGLNVMERSREIGILRSLGARRPLLRRLIIVEGIAVGLLSCATGIILSVPLTMLLARSLGQTLLLRPLDYIFPTAALGAWIGIIVVISVAASWLPAENAARLTVREALAYDG